MTQPIEIKTQKWTIQYQAKMIDGTVLDVFTGESASPITPPTPGGGVSYDSKRYLTESVLVTVIPKTSSVDLATVITVGLREIPAACKLPEMTL